VIDKMSNGLKGKVVAILGLSFKPNVDDIRESPAVKLARQIAKLGAEVYAYEPFRTNASIEGIHQAKDLEGALTKADVIVLAVGHDQFKELDPQLVRGMTPAKMVFDAVNVWNKPSWETAGFHFSGLARKY